MTALQKLHHFLNDPAIRIAPVVDFDPQQDVLLPLDFTANNTSLDEETLADTDTFTSWVEDRLQRAGARYGIGGYNEHRTIYSRSTHFSEVEEPRRLHLGTDIWGAAGTPVYTFYDGKVHSFAFNDRFGDYGATLIMEYELQGLTLFVLYGHLSLDSLNGLVPGAFYAAGTQIARFGTKTENGYWPPHLHFQLLFDLEGWVGDYPGVCQYTKREGFLMNCPDPAHILRYTFGQKPE